MGDMVNERIFFGLKARIRGVLNDVVSLPAKTVVVLSDRIATEAALAVDEEVAAVVEACGLRDDEVGGSFVD